MAGEFASKTCAKLIAAETQKSRRKLKFFRVYIACIMLRHAQKKKNYQRKVKSDFPEQGQKKCKKKGQQFC